MLLRLSVCRLIVAPAVVCGFLSSTFAQVGEGPKLTPVPMTDVHVGDMFWSSRLEVDRTVTVPHTIKMCEETGRLANFVKAARKQGKYEGAFYNDSDVYKVIEGAAYSLALHPDKQLEARVDKIIDDIAAAQQPDGYLNGYYTLMEPDKRWTSLNYKHELYCAGHLFEAAVAYEEATGKTKLLDAARRFADCIDSVFGPGKRIGWPGHEEIELALVKLYRATGEERHLKLAKWFVDVRGTTKLEDDNKPESRQAHKPVREQTDIVGHAVRAMYLYAGVADVAAYTNDESLFKTMDVIWDNVVHKKMYITGAVGARHTDEAFGDAYELPNRSAYCETCATIALALWNQRLALIHGDAKYADIVERAMYNGVLSGVSLQGDTFFYVNPLMDDGSHRRQPWYGTACCPSNIVRVVPSFVGWIYATDDNSVYVNQYVASVAKIKLKAGELRLTQATDYPWNGRITFTVDPDTPIEFTLKLRLPGWCGGSATFALEGQPVHDVKVEKGYAIIHRAWNAGETLEMDLPMEILRMQANPRVVEDRGHIALQRGPIVYCLEAADNNGRVFNLALPREAELRTEPRPEMLGGIHAITGRGMAAAPRDWQNQLYLPALPDAPGRPAEITAIPYYAWAHRDPGEMTVWIPESVTLADSAPK